MKNKVLITTAVFFTLVLFLIGLPNQVLAKTDPYSPTDVPAIPGIAQGTWQFVSSNGTEIDITAAASTAPEWLQLLSTNGASLTSGGMICHPLRGGQYGWIGQIRMLKDGEWVKVPTTNDWQPDHEGTFMSCAEVEETGTYALFGYFVAPE